MKQRKKAAAVGAVLLCCIMMWAAAPAQAAGIAGSAYKTFIYSDHAEESSTIISFEENGSLLIEAFEGVGLYVSAGGMFVSNFSAPNYLEKQDLTLFLIGVVVSDFLVGTGITLVDFEFYELFFFFGYAV